jgi:hypothetical protein
MEKDYCTRREEELEEQVLGLRVAFIFLGILAMSGLMLQQHYNDDLEGQLNNCVNSTNPCSNCNNYPVKEIFYVSLDDINKTKKLF